MIGEKKIFAESADIAVLEAAAKRLLVALDRLDDGCREPGFRGFENGNGEPVGDEVEDARQALTAILDRSQCKTNGADPLHPETKIGLEIVVCPGCGNHLPVENRGCPDCGYETNQNEDGRLLTIQELIDSPSYPSAGALVLNDVSPSFIRAVVAAAK